MKRRSVLLATGVGAAAAALGAGAAWWRLRPQESPLPPGFWEARFERPEGGELALAHFRGKPLVLNFWATWCPPCVTELPLLDAFHTQNAAGGWSVVGLAIDSPTPVREFLRKRPLALPVGLAGLDGVEFGRSLGNQQGGLPFTVVLDRAGAVGSRHLGALKEPDLAAWKQNIT